LLWAEAVAVADIARTTKTLKKFILGHPVGTVLVVKQKSGLQLISSVWLQQHTKLEGEIFLVNRGLQEILNEFFLSSRRSDYKLRRYFGNRVRIQKPLATYDPGKSSVTNSA
jgi:hypothetical protein